MSTYEERRARQIERNKALFKELELQNASTALNGADAKGKAARPAKRRKLDAVPVRPQRSSARIAASETRPLYSEEKVSGDILEQASGSKKKRAAPKALPTTRTEETRQPVSDIEELREQWTSWKPSEELPTRDENGEFYFASHPDFVPNKSPAEVLREGCFGGTYFRPLYSKTLGITISDDWRELPSDWISGLNVEKFLTSSTYDPEVNKFGVASGQTIEEWEANGWINHDYDVRGWFQWYCRFFQGRRCDDDERQISRWRKCVGSSGRWRRTLLKKYVAAGIRSATDEGDDEVEGVSPVIHQTCHHWAWEVRQDVLDDWWNR